MRVVVYSGLPGYVCGLGTVDGVGALKVGHAKSSEFEAVCTAERVCDTTLISVSLEARCRDGQSNSPESICVTAVTEARTNAGVLGITTACTIRRDERPWVALNLVRSGNNCLRHDFLRKHDLLRKGHSHSGRSGNSHCE